MVVCFETLDLENNFIVGFAFSCLVGVRVAFVICEALVFGVIEGVDLLATEAA